MKPWMRAFLPTFFKLIFAASMMLASLCICASAQWSFGLENYLHRKLVGPEAVRVIRAHLIESATDSGLESLVAWAKAGFPDLHDEHGIWSTEGMSVKLGVVHSIHYYFSTSPPADKSARYLAILDELRSDDYISFQLVGSAHLFVDESTLEPKVEQLLQESDAKLRAEGVRLGRTIAEHKPSLFDQYKQMLRSDNDPHVRTTILYSILGWRRKDVAYLAFERLVNDLDANVRDWGARGLRAAAEGRIFTADDLPKILPAMLETNEPFVRISIGQAAARVSTADQSLFIRTDKVTDELLHGFIGSVRMKGTRAGSALSEAQLAKEWLAWWTPLIPEYTKQAQLLH